MGKFAVRNKVVDAWQFTGTYESYQHIVDQLAPSTHGDVPRGRLLNPHKHIITNLTLNAVFAGDWFVDDDEAVYVMSARHFAIEFVPVETLAPVVDQLPVCNSLWRCKDERVDADDMYYVVVGLTRFHTEDAIWLNDALLVTYERAHGPDKKRYSREVTEFLRKFGPVHPDSTNLRYFRDMGYVTGNATTPASASDDHPAHGPEAHAQGQSPHTPLRAED